MKKKCKACGEDKELECFSKDLRLKDGHRGECKICSSKRTIRNKKSKKEGTIPFPF